MLSVGSLFSGIGGIELGFERTGGFETKWFVENDLYAQAVLKKHWPSRRIYDDITRIKWEEVEKVDVLTGGFPCQDISIAGRGAGIKKGTRSSLWRHYAEAIRILRPKYAVIENVPRLTTKGLDIILTDLARIGYDAEWKPVCAAEAGAKHKRKRLFIVAYPCKFGCNNRIYFKQDYEIRANKEWNAQEGWETWRDLAFRTSENIRSGKWRDNQSRVCGMASGVPHWVDRIKCLGNAVVPQVAQFVAERIKEKELKCA